MTITEAMKELKMILKRMSDNAKLINEYAAVPSDRRIDFGTADQQKKEIRGLVQANSDLMKNYLNLKMRIELSNLLVKVDIGGQTYSLSELLVLKRSLAKMMETTYASMNESHAEQYLTRRTGRMDDKPITIERYYDEKEKREGIRYYQDLRHEIDKRLETVNATTELAELRDITM